MGLSTLEKIAIIISTKQTVLEISDTFYNNINMAFNPSVNAYLKCESAAGASCESGISEGLIRVPRTTTTLKTPKPP